MTEARFRLPRPAAGLDSGGARRPLAPASVSVSLYVHSSEPREALRDLIEQAVLAESVGFDGVTVSEHHAGHEGYVPNPMLAAGWLLDATQRLWVAPCPVVLPLRPAALVAEEIAWLAARFPGRVGAGFAPGSAPRDFELAGADSATRRQVFRRGLAEVAAILRGEVEPPLSLDPAVAQCATSPVPCVSTVGGPVGASAAAVAGVGIVPSSSATPEEVRTLVDHYRASGGSRVRLINRRAWFGRSDGDRLRALETTFRRSRRLASSEASSHYKADYIASPDPAAVARDLARLLGSCGGTALNLKFYYPGLTARSMHHQLATFGNEVIPLLHQELLASAEQTP